MDDSDLEKESRELRLALRIDYENQLRILKTMLRRVQAAIVNLAAPDTPSGELQSIAQFVEATSVRSTGSNLLSADVQRKYREYTGRTISPVHLGRLLAKAGYRSVSARGERFIRGRAWL